MITWTTPTLPILVKGGNILSTNCRVLFTFKQDGVKELTLEPDSMTATEEGVLCEVSMTQLQSGGFRADAAKVQVNVIDSNNLRAASTFKREYLGSNLIEREVNYDV